MLRRRLELCVLALVACASSAGNFSVPDDLVVPCSNFREVRAPHGAGCRKRLQQLPSHSDERQTLSARIDALHKAGPTESWMRQDDWDMLSTYMFPLRVGLTASMTGSRSSAGSYDTIISALESWAVKAMFEPVRLWGLYPMCVEICLEDDKSDKQTALDIYERFANPASEHDVDLLLGPVTADFKEDVAAIAHRHDKLLMLWSYGSNHYDNGLGSTRGQFTDEITGERVYLQIGRNLPLRANGELLRPYVNYSATTGALEGLTATSTNGSNPTWEHSFMLSLSDFPVIVFTVKDQLGEKQQPNDPIVAEVWWQSHYGDFETEVLPLQRPSPSVAGYAYYPVMELHVRMVLEDHSLVAHWAERFTEYNASLNEVAAELEYHGKSLGIKPPVHDVSAYLDYDGVKRTFGVSGYTFAWVHGNARETLDVLASRPQSNSVWRVEGSCVVDAEDCLTSPNYPKPYTESDQCFAIASETGSSARRLVMRVFDTEALHDTLLLNDVFYHGHDVELGGVTLTGEIELQWYSDSSVSGGGWRLCPEETVLDSCDEFACPAGLRHKINAHEINCGGQCSNDECCEQALKDVDSDLFSRGYTNLIDLTVPRSRWALHPLAELQERGAKRLSAMVTGFPESTTMLRCNTTLHLAREELGYELVSEQPETFDWTFATDHHLVNDAFVGSGADVLLLCGDMKTNGLFLTMEEGRRTNHAAVVLMQPFGQPLNDVYHGLVNYVIEPLPWPSPLWVWDNFPEDLPDTVADMQIASVGQMVAAAVGQLPRDTKEVWPALKPGRFRDILLNTRMRTYVGDVAFESTGKRTTNGLSNGLSSRQFHPLSEMRGRSARTTWTYWQARSVFSELFVVTHNMTRVQELERIYPEDFENRYQQLVYPQPLWQDRAYATYPCPLGLVSVGSGCIPCPPGTIRGPTQLHCVPCERGTLATRYGLSTCQACPKGSDCKLGPSQAPVAQPGFWDTSTLSGEPQQDMNVFSVDSGVFPGDVLVEHPVRKFVPCDPPLLCLGGPRGQGCKGHNAGVMCRSCESGYSWQYFGSGRRLCVECPSMTWVLGVHLSPVLVIFLALTVMWEFSASRGAADPNSLVCPLLKLTFNHFTIYNVIIEGMKLDRRPDLPNTWDVITRPQEVSYLDCLSADQNDELRAFNEIFAAIGFAVFGFVAVFMTMCVRLAFLQGRIFILWSKRMIDAPETSYSCWRYMVIQEQQRMMSIISTSIRQATVWQIICFPVVTRAGAVAVNTTIIDGECRISKFLDVTCDSEVYQDMVLPAAWAAIFMSMALPVPLTMAIYKYRKSLQEVDIRIFLAPFVHGYKQGLELCEVGFFLRMVVVLLALSTKSFTRVVMIFLAIFLNEAIIISFEPFVPQERNLLALYSKFSFRILMFVLCIGAAFSFANDVTVSNLLEEQLEEGGGSILDWIKHRSYGVTFVCFFLNGCLVSTTFVFIFYNQVIIPNAVKIISGDRKHVHPFMRRIVAALKFHPIQLKEEEDGHFSMAVGRLTDGERGLLNHGIFQTMIICLGVNNVSFSMLNTMRVLQEALRRAGAAHRARGRVHEEIKESAVSDSGILRNFRHRRKQQREVLGRQRAIGSQRATAKTFSERVLTPLSGFSSSSSRMKRATTVVSLDEEASLANAIAGKSTQVDIMVDELYTYLRDVHIDIVKRHPLMHFVHPHKATHPDHPHHSTAPRKRRTAPSMGDEIDEFSTWCVGDEATSPKERTSSSQGGEAIQALPINRMTRGRSRLQTDQTASRSVMDFLGPAASASVGAAGDVSRTSLGTGVASESLGAGVASASVGLASASMGVASASMAVASTSLQQEAPPATQAPETRSSRKSKKMSKEELKALAEQEDEKMVAEEMAKQEVFQQTNDRAVLRRRLLELRVEARDLRDQLRKRTPRLEDAQGAPATATPEDATEDSGKPEADKQPGSDPKNILEHFGNWLEKDTSERIHVGTLEGVHRGKEGVHMEALEAHGRKDKPRRPTEELQREHHLAFPDPLPPPPGPPPPNAPKIGFIGMRWPGGKQSGTEENSVVGSV